MSQRDIEDNLREIYGAEIPQTLISKITDKILPEVNEWQNRPLESIYPIIYFDGIVFKSRHNGHIINKCVYSILGVDMEGHKDILGVWIGENESASFYANICSDLKKRGVSDIFIILEIIPITLRNFQNPIKGRLCLSVGRILTIAKTLYPEINISFLLKMSSF